jgi:hypothetical protein
MPGSHDLLVAFIGTETFDDGNAALSMRILRVGRDGTSVFDPTTSPRYASMFPSAPLVLPFTLLSTGPWPNPPAR